MRAFLLGLALSTMGQTATAAPLDADIARTNRMIRQAHAEEVLDNATTAADEPTVLHRASGLKCRFLLGLGDLRYFPEQRSVLCEMRRSTFGYSLSAFPYREGDTLASVESELRANLVGSRRAKEIPLATYDNAFTAGSNVPAFVASRFQVGRDFWRISVVRSGDWWITSAALSPQGPNVMQAMLQSAEWADVLKALPTATPH